VKVDYITLDNCTSIAYLDSREGEFWIGTDKHTDQPVRVYWNDDPEISSWVEVARVAS